VTLGDTAELTRRKGETAPDGWVSLMRGDEYFFDQVERNLRELVAGGNPPDHPPAVDLTLSATLVEPVRRPARSPSDQELTDLRFASGFAFTRPWHAWLPSDFPRWHLV
jgi:hypothetical protein